MATGKRQRPAKAAAPPAASAPAEIDSPALDTVFGYLLRRAHYVYNTYWLTHFRATETPITPMQAGVLLMLRRHPDVTQSELGRLMGIEAPTAFNLVSKLEKPGYIERVQDGADKRAQMLRLTPAGLEILKAVAELVPIRDADLMAGISEADRALLARLLVRIIVNGNDHLGISQQVISAAGIDSPSTAADADGGEEDSARRGRNGGRTPPRKWRAHKRRE